MFFEFDLGILGGGQLARMSIQAAQKMGLKCLSLDQDAASPAAQIAPSVTGSIYDPEFIGQLFANCAVVTLENEFVPAAAIRQACEAIGREDPALVPGIDALETIQDKLLQRKAYSKAGVPSPKAVAIEDDGSVAIAQIGFPMVLKARTGGYDGKGTRTAKSADDFDDYRTLWAGGGWLAEEFVEFKRELAVMVFRTPTAQGSFPTMVTVQANHICDLVYPADVDASQVALAAVEAVGGEGLFGVELFEKSDGTLVVNEMAPRPHNSGHYTLDWGGVSQFEQHVRLALSLPPSEPRGQGVSMANLIGQNGVGDFRLGLIAVMEHDPGVRFHWYGKEQPRPGRKMGHINVAGENTTERAMGAREVFYKAWIEAGLKP